MKNLIDQIIEIDKNARAQVVQASEEAQGIVDEANKKRSELQGDYAERVEKRLSTVEETYKKFADDEITALEKEKSERFSALDKLMQDNCKDWEAEIINRITG